MIRTERSSSRTHAAPCLARAIFFTLCLVGTDVHADEFCSVEFPSGAASFADVVTSYDPAAGGGAVPSAANAEPSNALAPPDTNGGVTPCSQGACTGDPSACPFVSLGDGGQLVVQFTDNALTGSGDASPDLWIFEVGPQVENTFVEISVDGVAWNAVGQVSGSISSVDIDAFGFGPGIAFSFVRLTDDPDEGGQTGVSVGADIDAIGALNTVPVTAGNPWSPSSDVGIQLAGSAFTRGDVVADGTAPSAPGLDLGPLPPGADVTAYSSNDVGTFFVLDQVTELQPGVIAYPTRLMQWNGTTGTYSVAADFGAFSVPYGVKIDALSVTPFGYFVSFDTTQSLGALTIDDADVVELVFGSVPLDADAAGIPKPLDVDAVAWDGDDLIVSFDTGGEIDGIAFADEDLLRVDPATYTWSLEVDASLADAAWHRGDVDALEVPEPRAWLAWPPMLLSLALLTRSRRRARRSGVR